MSSSNPTTLSPSKTLYHDCTIVACTLYNRTVVVHMLAIVGFTSSIYVIMAQFFFLFFFGGGLNLTLRCLTLYDTHPFQHYLIWR